MASEEFQLKKVLEMIEKEKGIDRNTLIDTIESAVLKAARKKLGLGLDLEARFNEEKGEVEVFRWLRVVDEVEDGDREISVEEARQKLDPNCDVNDELGAKIDISEFGRIAAQSAKQELIRRVRDAERELVYAEYKDRKGEIVTGIVRRNERQNLIIDLGRAEALLPKDEQIPKETTVRIGDRLQAYIKDVRNEENKPIVTLSRTDEGFLVKLFEMEVPEIYEGIVKIMSASRDPGIRAKIAVTSRDNDVDPVGACVGVKGARVQAVVQELRGEKIDIVLYSEDPARFVCNAIAPAQVSRVIIDEDARSMELIVPDDQLSLAIGRKGQNVRLASKLTNWRIDILSEQDVQREQENTVAKMAEVGQIERELLQPLFKLGYRSASDIVKADIEDLAIIPSIGTDNAKQLRATAEAVVRQAEQERRSANKPKMPISKKKSISAEEMEEGSSTEEQTELSSTPSVEGAAPPPATATPPLMRMMPPAKEHQKTQQKKPNPTYPLAPSKPTQQK